MPDSETQQNAAAEMIPTHIPLTPWHRRLARYLYLDDLIRGRKLLEIGCGDGRAAAFLAQRGAGQVLGIDWDAEAIAQGRKTYRHNNLSLLHRDRADLLLPGGLAVGAEHPHFDLILLSDSSTSLLRADAFLAEVRRVLSPGGHVAVAVRSKEAFPEEADTLSYFEVLDRLEKVGRLGPVMMLGQSPFLATTLVPFGLEEPELVMDDSLALQEPPEEYFALCGPQSRQRPYQVIQLPTAALVQKPQAAPARKVPAAPEVDADPEKLQAQARGLREQQEALRRQVAQLQEAEVRSQSEAARTQGELAQAVASLRELQGRIAESEGRLRDSSAQAEELRERLKQRERSQTEQQEAALLHERQMRELRTVLDERDAYIAELEEQSAELQRLRERLRAAQERAEQAEHAERASRKRLAEVDGLLVRAQHELFQVTEGADRLAGAKGQSDRPYVDPGDAVALQDARAAIAAERAALEEERASLAVRAEERKSIEEARQALARGAEEITQLRDRLEAERLQASHDREELQRLREQVQQDRQALQGERSQFLHDRELAGIPVPVGDMPTAPHVSLTPQAAVSPHEEAARLQARIAELEVENVKLKDKASEAERDSWKYMKARSDAEAAAAEVRDDAARKLRDARKLASVELTRAMEEATKKAVQLREELTRTERDRKDALAQVKELRTARDNALRQIDGLRQEVEALRWSSALPVPPAPAPSGDDASVREVARAREEGAAAVLAVRAEAERAIAEERTARQGAEEAERRTSVRFEEVRGTVLQLELSLGEARDTAESEQKRVEMLQEELRRVGDEAAARHREAAAEVLKLQQDLQTRERELSDLRVEREALGRLLSEVEREAYSRAERARELRTRMLDRDREVEALRVELLDRDRKITALEQQTPPAEEIVRLEADLQATRARLMDLEAERARQDASSDEAVATALRERARAARLTESLQQAARERDEALGRIVELEGRISALSEERTRLRAELDRLEEMTRRAQTDVHSLNDRLKQTRRELEAEEKRAAREAERAQAAAELGRQLDEARRELSDLRVRMLELQAELARGRAELARLEMEGGQRDEATPAPEPGPAATASGTDSPPRPPVLEHHMVRRVLALGQALGLEPLHVPLHGEPTAEPTQPETAAAPAEPKKD